MAPLRNSSRQLISRRPGPCRLWLHRNRCGRTSTRPCRGATCVARLVREAVARHDPRVGGGGQRRRRRAGNADAAPERAPKRTRAAVAPAAAAQRGGSATPAPHGETGAASGQTPAPRLPATAPPRPPAPEPAAGVAPDGAAAGAPAGLASQLTRDSAHGPRRSPPRRPIPAAVRRHIWQRDGGRRG